MGKPICLAHSKRLGIFKNISRGQWIESKRSECWKVSSYFNVYVLSKLICVLINNSKIHKLAIQKVLFIFKEGKNMTSSTVN